MKVIKRNGKEERFSNTKLRRSIHKACLGAGFDVKKAKEVEKEVSKRVERNLKGRSEVSTIVIMRHVEKELKKINKDCTRVFKHYYDIN